MSSNIQIMEKPDWVSWDDIHQVLWKAHAANREHGINMRKPSLPGEEIKKEIGNDGVMLVALDGKKVVGTAALLFKQRPVWYNKEIYGYMCFAAILPEYRGSGIYKQLSEKREEIAKTHGLHGLYIDTHHKNTHLIKIALQNGYHKVDVKACKNHWNVVLFKWLSNCPYPSWYIKLRFHLSKFKLKTRYKMVPGKGRVKRFGIL